MSDVRGIVTASWEFGWTGYCRLVNPLNAELNPICYLLAL